MEVGVRSCTSEGQFKYWAECFRPCLSGCLGGPGLLGGRGDADDGRWGTSSMSESEANGTEQIAVWPPRRRGRRVRTGNGQRAPELSVYMVWRTVVYRPPMRTSGPSFLPTTPPLIARLRPGLPQPPVKLVSWGPSSGRKLPASKTRPPNLSKELFDGS